MGISSRRVYVLSFGNQLVDVIVTKDILWLGLKKIEQIVIFHFRHFGRAKDAKIL